jgi:nucleotide-binding universal stress UspA family protein
MKTILVATDFTPASANALHYAVKLAMPYNARVVLYHAFLSEIYIPDFALLPAEVNLQQECEELLKQQVLKLDSEFRYFVETKCEPGAAPESILQAAKNLHASLIVLGIKRNGNGLRRLFGSTAFPVYRNAVIPVIAVPETKHFSGLTNIALASDLVVKNNCNLLNPLVSIVNRFNSNLHVVNIVDKLTGQEKLTTAFEINLALNTVSPHYHFIEDSDIYKALTSFVEKDSIDLLAVVAHPYSVLERVFVRSNIQQLMLHGNVPLLILPDRVDKKANTSSAEQVIS